jgi:hypothetical protein
MNFVLVNQQHINVSNPMSKETIMSHQEEIKNDSFLYRKVMQSFVGTYAKDDISSSIHD